jgi:N-methylhydantoinase A
MMHDPADRVSDPLVPSDLTFGVAERVRADGTMLRGPDEKQVEALAAKLKAKGVESVAICFLNSYANPDNERAVGRQLAALLPDVFVTPRRLPRKSAYFASTAVNAYHADLAVHPRASSALKREGFRIRR